MRSFIREVTSKLITSNNIIYIYIIILSCHQHGYPRPSLANPPYCSSPLACPQGYTLYLRRAEYVGSSWSPAYARTCEGVHRSTSLMNSSLILLQCPACLVRLTLIVFVMGGWWPYSCCFVGCCLQD